MLGERHNIVERGMVAVNAFDLKRRDAVAKRFDNFVAPPQKENVTIRILYRIVSGEKPVALELCCSLFGRRASIR
jgi:hypothetical protein